MVGVRDGTPTSILDFDEETLLVVAISASEVPPAIGGHQLDEGNAIVHIGEGQCTSRTRMLEPDDSTMRVASEFNPVRTAILDRLQAPLAPHQRKHVGDEGAPARVFDDAHAARVDAFELDAVPRMRHPAIDPSTKIDFLAVWSHVDEPVHGLQQPMIPVRTPTRSERCRILPSPRRYVELSAHEERGIMPRHGERKKRVPAKVSA
ncbi:hypothetical protein LVJ94_15425 [Pendulispora rubella]|uniref:Uncharacterized protein n=1 Tax=Pendulispora rubella TaxID=2741070 RepID=A0ABZ2LFG1_9BACT